MLLRSIGGSGAWKFVPGYDGGNHTIREVFAFGWRCYNRRTPPGNGTVWAWGPHAYTVVCPD